VLKEYKKIARNGVDAKELKKAKECIKGRMAMGLESSDDIAEYLASQEVIRDEITIPEVIAKRIDRVSTGDIQRVAKEIFRSDRLNFSVIGPDVDEKKIASLLKL
jgi:predicted Zn-dependent peptidase